MPSGTTTTTTWSRESSDARYVACLAILILGVGVMGVPWERGCDGAGVPWMADFAQLLLLIGSWCSVFFMRGRSVRDRV